MNLLLLVLAVLGFCYAQERRALGPDWEIGIERSVEVPALEPGASPWALWQKIENLFDCAQGATYIFYGPDGARYAAPCGDFVRVLAPALGALLLIEFLFILGQLFSGRRMARRLLRPLDRMARAARELGKSATRASAPQPNVNLHDLEDAISRISPDRPEEKRTWAVRPRRASGCHQRPLSLHARGLSQAGAVRIGRFCTNCARPSPSCRATRACSTAGASRMKDTGRIHRRHQERGRLHEQVGRATALPRARRYRAATAWSPSRWIWAN